MKVNFVNLNVQYLSIKKEINCAIRNVIDDSAFASGPFVKSFEENYASAHNTKYCVGVNSGISYLHIARCELDINQGDDVLVPANTFFATAEAISLCGAKPVFVACEPDYYNINPKKIKKAIEKIKVELEE